MNTVYQILRYPYGSTLVGIIMCCLTSNIMAPCGLWGCKNRPVPFPGQMLYKATKPGLVLFYVLACFNIVLLLIRAGFYILLILVGMCSVFWLF